MDTSRRLSPSLTGPPFVLPLVGPARRHSLRPTPCGVKGQRVGTLEDTEEENIKDRGESPQTPPGRPRPLSLQSVRTPGRHGTRTRFLKFPVSSGDPTRETVSVRKGGPRTCRYDGLSHVGPDPSGLVGNPRNRYVSLHSQTPVSSGILTANGDFGSEGTETDGAPGYDDPILTSTAFGATE